MPLNQFSPPASVNDLAAALLPKWSAEVSKWFDKAVQRIKQGTNQPDNKIYLFNELHHPEAANGAVAEIPWNGYPRKYTLAIPNAADRLFKTEQLYSFDLNGGSSGYAYKVNGKYQPAMDMVFRDQDEYCEWHPVLDPVSKNLKKVIFSCENPEYWTFIAQNDKALLLQLYSQLSGSNVVEKDVYFQEDIYQQQDDGGYLSLKGQYNPLNVWNTQKGIIHLTHPANSLSAEVFLAGDATIIRKDSTGKVITLDKDLICCSGYGNPNRSSDPTIGSKVNGIVQGSSSVTLNDPVGLYIKEIDSSGIDLPAGVQFSDCWKIIRGKENMILRVEFSLPNNADLQTVNVGGLPLKFGGQLAQLITMVIYGKAFDFKNGQPLAQACACHCCADTTYSQLINPQDIKKPCGSHIISGTQQLQASAFSQSLTTGNNGKGVQRKLKTRV